MKNLSIVLLFLFGFGVCSAQTITDQKEAERIYKEHNEEMKTAKLYFAEDDKCSKLLKEKKYVEAESAGRRLISIAEKLPKSRYMEKHSAYELLGLALLRQRKAEEAIVYFNKSLDVAKPNIDDTDSETAEIYYFLGQANHLLEKFELSRQFYTKAENAYRAAFVKIDEDEIRQFYPKPIINILKAHIIVAEDAGLAAEAAKIKKRLAETEVEFAKFLNN